MSYWGDLKDDCEGMAVPSLAAPITAPPREAFVVRRGPTHVSVLEKRPSVVVLPTDPFDRAVFCMYYGEHFDGDNDEDARRFARFALMYTKALQLGPYSPGAVLE